MTPVPRTMACTARGVDANRVSSSAAGAAGFEPRVAAMAAALPYCDALLPADTFRSLRDALNSITPHGSRDGTARR